MKTRNFILSFLMMVFCSVAFGQNSYDWGELNYHNYPNSQQVYAVVKLDGVLNNSQNFEIAPFCGDQLRGDAARPIYYGDKYGYMFTFSVFGNVGDVITFRLYDYDTETLYDNVSVTEITWTGNPWGMMSRPNDIAFNSVAEVAGVKYGSLAKAVERATTGATVNVINNVTLSEGIVISKHLTLNLNDNEITTNGDFYPVIRVQGGAEVTVTGEGSIEHNDYIFVLGASDGSSAGNLIIEKGSYVGGTTVASVTKGNLVIEGGDFSLVEGTTDYRYLINCIDANYKDGSANVSITGGTFYGFNPENNAAEGANTNFCPQTPVKYIAVENPAGVFTVQEGAWVAQNTTTNVKYQSLQEAYAAADDGQTVTLLADISLTETIKITKNIVLDLNGKTITGTDNVTASFALIEVQPEKELTVKGNGVITLTSLNNRGWNAFSSVISNQRGKLVVDGATIEHFGGTDMAYAIDNLTNTGAQIAETVINAGTIKSTYRAIRQFLNSSAQGVNNILTVNGGTIEGANKSIWMQDTNAKANPGKLTVSEDAVLKGDVYLFVTAGSTEWPVEVSIAATAFNGESTVLTGNVPAKYEVKLVEGYYTVVVLDPVAKIGETLYYSLQAAFEAAAEGQTVVMLGDVTEDFAINNDANVTFDMGTNTLTGAILPSKANLTINGGTITNIDESRSAIEINEGSLALNNVNVSSARHAIRIKGEAVNVTINGGTYSVKVDAGATMNTRHALYVEGQNAIVTVTDGEFIGPKGSTSDSGSAVTVKAGSEVYVSGGKFSGGKNNTLSASGTLSLTGGIYDQDVQQYCAENYEAKNQGDGTYIVRRKPAGHVAYRADVTDKADREGIAILLKEVYAFESLVVKVYNNETLMFTSTRREIDDEDKVMFPVEGKNTTANIVLWGSESGSWINEILVEPTELNVPNKIEVWSDGVLVDSYTHESGTVLGTNLEKYLALDCVKKVIAKVGETKYISLKDAINACTNGETVTIIRDVTYKSEDVVNAIGGATGFGQYPNPCIVDIGGQKGENGAANIPSSVNAIVDLNGHTLTNKAEACFFIIMDNAKVVFTDSSADKTGKVITNVDAPAVWVVGTETLVTIEGGYFQTAYALGLLHSTHGGDLVIAGGEFKTTAERTNLLIMLNSKDRQNSANFIKGAATVSIKGGIFHGFNPSMVGDDNGATSIENIRFVNGCADGYAPIMVDENTYTVIPAVAKIGEKYYATLAEAVGAVTERQTVVLLKDVELENTLTIAAGKVVTLDLNGNVVSGVSATAGTTAVITNKGNLTVMSSVEGGKITSQALTPDTNWGGEGEPSFPSYANNTVRNEGTFTLVSGTIENTSAAGGATYAIDNYNGSTTNINGGLVYCQNNIAIRLFCGDNIALNVNGGEIIGTRALWIQLASSNASVAPNVDVNITNGTLTATGNGEYKLAIYSYSYGNNMQNVEINISGGTFNGDIALTGGSNKENVETLNITGGTFNGKDGDVYSYGDDAKAIDAITIKGGIFNSNYAEKYAEDNGYVFVANADGKYVATVGAYVAQIGETRYTSLAKAIAAATAGQTIEFIADITEDVTITKNITIDGDGFDYTGTMTLNNINVTIQNVDFVKGQIYKNKKSGTTANVTVKGCTFDGQGLNAYAINVGGANNTIIENVTAKDYGYGLLQITGSGKSSTNIIAKDVTIDNVNYGFKIDYASSVSFDNVTMTNVAYYGIYDSNYGTKTYTVKNSTISSIQIWEREGKTGVATFDFVGANTVGTLDDSQYAKYVLTATDATLTAPEGHTVTTTVDGHVAVWNAGVYSVKEAVAQIGDNYYASIQDAINAAETGDQIVMLKDIEMNDDDVIMVTTSYKAMLYVAGKDITLNMNGCKIDAKYTGNPYLFSVVCVEDAAGLTVTGNGSIDVEGVAYGNDFNVAYIFHKKGNTGHLTIEDGTYHAADLEDSMVYTNGNGIVTINGGTFTLVNVGTQANGCPWIFNAQGKNEQYINVYGGTYNFDVNHQHWCYEVNVPVEKALQNNGNGTWTVVDAVAKANDDLNGGEVRVIGYATLADAVNNVEEGYTVTVIKEHVTTTTAVVKKDMTIDFAGYAITGDIYPVVRIQNNANVTVKNGNITNGDYIFTLGEGATESATSGNLIIKGGKYHGETTVANVVKGLLTINGGEFSADPAPEEYGGDYRYLINCYDANYKNGTANVSITGGTFYNWNPENNAAEGANTNFCAAGYGAVETDSNIWTVVPKQSQTLAAGWNWYSSYIEADNLLAQLQEGLEANGIEIKNHLGQFTDYNEADGEWYGSLRSISVSEMYMIENVNSANIVVLGNIVDPSKPENAIAIKSEWNWIGYPMTEELSVSQALNGYQATEGDIIKSHNGSFSTYIEGYGWTSGLNKMEPCKGYMYYSYAETSKKFNYSYPRSKEAVEANVTPANNYWVPNTSAFAGNMSVMAVLNVDGNEMKEGFEVAAFVNGEVRGSARPTYVEAIDRYVLFLSVCGENGEEVTFKYVDMYSEEEYTIDNKVVYEDNAIIGSVRDLYVLTLNTMGIDENGYSTISLYPNPTTTNTAISFETVCDMVEVFNSLGAKVAEYSNVDRIDGMEAAGVYVIRVTNGSTVQNCRLIVK